MVRLRVDITIRLRRMRFAWKFFMPNYLLNINMNKNYLNQFDLLSQQFIVSPSSTFLLWNKFNYMHQPITQSYLPLPINEEWSILYKHRAQSIQKAQSLEKALSQQKKDNLKSELEHQIAFKRSNNDVQKQDDRKYYNYITTAAQQAKELQEKQKFNKYLQLKQIQHQNKKKSQTTSSRLQVKEQETDHLQIGLRSELQKKQRAQSIKKEVAISLDQQLMEKYQQKVQQRKSQIDQFRKNEAYLAQQFNNRHNTKKYGQNEEIYNHYRQLHIQKKLRDRQLQHKLVDQAGQIKQQMYAIKNENSSIEKERKKMEIKDTLQKQVQLQNLRKKQQKNTNPQEASYSFLSNVFQQKKRPFNKQQYYDFLGRQAQEQRAKKLQQKYMSPQEYKFNSNQLNKALNPNSSFEHYQERSIAFLGDRTTIAADPIQGQDAQIVKHNLDLIKNKSSRKSSNMSYLASDYTTL